jgi:hypothetical protein
MLRMGLHMSSKTVTGESVPLQPEEAPEKRLSKQIRRAADQLAFDRNCQLIDSFIQTKWPEKVDAT